MSGTWSWEEEAHGEGLGSGGGVYTLHTKTREDRLQGGPQVMMAPALAGALLAV